MHKRFAGILGVAILVGVVLLALSAGTTYAQGPRQGQGQRGGRAGSQGNTAGQNGQQLHDPQFLAGDAAGTGRSNRGQGRGSQSQSGQSGIGQGLYTANQVPVEGNLTADIIAALTAGLTDEHHAFDTYQAIIDQFGPVAPFVSIQRAEANHIAALERVFTSYGLAIPAVEPLAVDAAFDSMADACAAGAAAEIANFALYDSWLATVSDYPDLVRVFTALRDASEFSHLPAFQACAG